ncbi:MAG TPA: phosphatidylserine decarboxylase [Bauldia sp.]|nr:phosphatidylserine decarboxylase [Bauldia sp.]
MTTPETIIASIRKMLVPVRPEGYPFVAILAVVALFFGWFWQPVLWIGLILAAWCAYFFRDPPRVTPLDDALVVSPADGRIVAVSLGVAPKELGLGEKTRRRVSIVLGLFDCHVNRAPVAGRVARIVYQPGRHGPTDVVQSADGYERNGFVIEATNGPIGVVQIAGRVARRIVSLRSEGDQLAQGERIGLIRFGSQVDLYLPVAAGVIVAEGQTAIAGETVIARFGAAVSDTRVRID